MPDEGMIHVNFARPMALFALPSPALLPQQVLSLHIVEPRYVQMVEHALNGTGQFAVAVFAGTQWKQEYHGRPPLRPAVCVAHILRHEHQPDGTYLLLVQGVCRAKIVRELPPEEGRLYRLAMLQPVGANAAGMETRLYGVRERLVELLEDSLLNELQHAEELAAQIRREQVSVPVLLELVAFALPTRPEMRYRLLEEPDPARRAELIEGELRAMIRVLQQAKGQHPEQWPKGVSWN